MAKRWFWIAGILVSLAVIGLLRARLASRGPDAVTISCASIGKELELCQQGAREWSRKTGIPVQVIAAPSDASERLGLYILLLAAKSPDIDVFSVDTTWPGIMGDYFLDLREQAEASLERDTFPGFLANNTVGGRLVALPWYIDAGLLYYRKDLLDRYGEKAPESWQELDRIAEKIQRKERERGNAGLWGFVFQGRAYEGLTCNALEWIASFGGGTIVDEAGQVTIDNPATRQALELAARWPGRISPPGVLNYAEEESRGVFQSGHAIFMRNWPYAWKLANGEDSPVRGKVGISVLPGSTAVLGGWSLAVSRHSRHAHEATSLALYLTSRAEQSRRYVEGGFQPTWVSLYREPRLLRSNPFLSTLEKVFSSAIPRPSRATHALYNKVSTEFFEAVHRVLSGDEAATEAVAGLSTDLKRIGRDGRW